MTSQKQLKSRIRARMARTGERYAVARRHLLGDATGRAGQNATTGPVIDHGWTLHGGTDPDAAALANVLANRGVHGPDGPLSEALVFGVAGGIGAGYILWEFKHDDSRHVTLGFSHRGQYIEDRLRPAADRLGLRADWVRTGSTKTAASSLRRHLAAGDAVMIWPDRYHVGYWHLPFFDGHGGHCVVAYAIDDDRVHLDDRNLAPLTVGVDALDRARARVGSYQNSAFVIGTRDATIDGDTLRTAVRAGLESCVEQLSGSSDSFSLPAWRKWSRMLVDTRNAKAWPNVFADRRGLFAGLLSAWEGVSPAGMTGGHLRDLFCDTLAEAADVLATPALDAESGRWREIAELWHDLGETAVPADVPAVLRARELTAAVTGAVAEGDEGAADRAAAAKELWALRAEHDAEPPFEADRDREIFAAMSEQLAAIYETETAAIASLTTLLRSLE